MPFIKNAPAEMSTTPTGAEKTTATLHAELTDRLQTLADSLTGFAAMFPRDISVVVSKVELRAMRDSVCVCASLADGILEKNAQQEWRIAVVEGR